MIGMIATIILIILGTSSREIRTITRMKRGNITQHNPSYGDTIFFLKKRYPKSWESPILAFGKSTQKVACLGMRGTNP